MPPFITSLTAFATLPTPRQNCSTYRHSPSPPPTAPNQLSISNPCSNTRGAPTVPCRGHRRSATEHSLYSNIANFFFLTFPHYPRTFLTRFMSILPPSIRPWRPTVVTLNPLKMPLFSSKPVDSASYLVFSGDSPKRSDNSLNPDPFSFGMSEKQACVGGPMARAGVQAESTEVF